jgi:hypothetical protein
MQNLIMGFFIDANDFATMICFNSKVLVLVQILNLFSPKKIGFNSIVFIIVFVATSNDLG